MSFAEFWSAYLWPLIVMVAQSVLLLVAFVDLESHVAQPLLPLS